MFQNAASDSAALQTGIRHRLPDPLVQWRLPMGPRLTGRRRSRAEPGVGRCREVRDGSPRVANRENTQPINAARALCLALLMSGDKSPLTLTRQG